MAYSEKNAKICSTVLKPITANNMLVQVSNSRPIDGFGHVVYSESDSVDNLRHSFSFRLSTRNLYLSFP